MTDKQAETMLKKIAALQVKIDRLSNTNDAEISEAISGASASLEIAIELLMQKINY